MNYILVCNEMCRFQIHCSLQDKATYLDRACVSSRIKKKIEEHITFLTISIDDLQFMFLSYTNTFFKLNKDTCNYQVTK